MQTIATEQDQRPYDDYLPEYSGPLVELIQHLNDRQDRGIAKVTVELSAIVPPSGYAGWAIYDESV